MDSILLIRCAFYEKVDVLFWLGERWLINDLVFITFLS